MQLDIGNEPYLLKQKFHAHLLTWMCHTHSWLQQLLYFIQFQTDGRTDGQKAMQYAQAGSNRVMVQNHIAQLAKG